MPQTKEVSYQAANAWWTAKRAEIDKSTSPPPDRHHEWVISKLERGHADHMTWATSSCSVPPRTARSDGSEPTGQGGLPEAIGLLVARFCLQTVEVPGRGGRSRTHGAGGNWLATKVRVEVPAIWQARHPEWRPIPAWVERVWEPEPPAGVEEPLEWILLSSLPVQTEAELLLRQAWYQRRLIEDFHQVEKTGCGEEDLRFETARALLPMLGVLSVVAVRML